eukprot:TRINITY_DN3220_c0_g1_i3.p2 TRINITY_DN3220_c0_g1~~TRINITY_DN3220_c0_g1_i3.p2  ORF type:complete len:140 (+),score=16.81 TRINITY_DN3220_c0_g1_i3:107-526(+)
MFFSLLHEFGDKSLQIHISIDESLRNSFRFVSSSGSSLRKLGHKNFRRKSFKDFLLSDSFFLVDSSQGSDLFSFRLHLFFHFINLLLMFKILGCQRHNVFMQIIPDFLGLLNSIQLLDEFLQTSGRVSQFFQFIHALSF